MAVKASPLYLCILMGWVLNNAGALQTRELTYFSDNKTESVKLYGNVHTYAYWFVDLLVGTPPQRTSVIVDTGSTVCAFACSACSHCGSHMDKSFDIAASSTAAWSSCASDCPSGTCSENQCSYSISYSEGSSLSGFWFTDVVQLGDLVEENLAMKSYLGCHTSENNLFYTQSAGGILGLAPARNDEFPMILGSLFSDNRINKQVFSLCLSAEGGELTVGGHIGNESELVFFPMKTVTFYTISLSEVSIGSSVIGTVFAPAIIDSGTTLTYIPPETYNKLSEKIETVVESKKISKYSNRCWETWDFSYFPNISFHFEGSPETVIWGPDSYLYKSKERMLCYAFAASGNSRETVLGASFLVNRNVVFDLDRGRLGMANHDCPTHTERPNHVVSDEVDDEPSSTTAPSTTAVPATTSAEVMALKLNSEEEATTIAVTSTPESTTITPIPSNEDSIWFVWVVVLVLACSVGVIVYRRRLRLLGPPADPEREQLNNP